MKWSNSKVGAQQDVWHARCTAGACQVMPSWAAAHISTHRICNTCSSQPGIRNSLYQLPVPIHSLSFTLSPPATHSISLLFSLTCQCEVHLVLHQKVLNVLPQVVTHNSVLLVLHVQKAESDVVHHATCSKCASQHQALRQAHSGSALVHCTTLAAHRWIRVLGEGAMQVGAGGRWATIRHPRHMGHQHKPVTQLRHRTPHRNTRRLIQTQGN